MDTLRGNLSGYSSPDDDGPSYDRGEEENYREMPPAAIGQDERRMQVRAYNFWASLLTDRNLPSIEDLDPDNLPDFGPNSVLLDFSCGIDDPAIVFLGDRLAAECGTVGPIARLSDVPSRSLLSRITDHHLQIIANQAPIGFEAEFVNQTGAAIMYRGILLPFSSDDDTIDFIFGVINWKEIADQQTTDELLLEIDQALLAAPETTRIDVPLTDWADGPLDSAGQSTIDDGDDGSDDDIPVVWPVASIPAETAEPAAAELPEEDLPAPTFGRRRRGLVANTDWSNPAEVEAVSEPERATGSFASLTNIAPIPARPPEALDWGERAAQPAEFDGDTLDLGGFAELDASYDEAAVSEAGSTEPAGLADWLAAARELAYAAQTSDDRTRQSLYVAIGRAYDFSLAAANDPLGYAELVADAGLTMQERAPMTPLVKLVFGANYDKTRLTEYAAALVHAGRIGLERGALENYLLFAPGGLKGVVQAERQLRRDEAGVAKAPRNPGERLARKLRKLEARPLDEISAQGSEFTLLVARRMESGEIVLLGEVGDDTTLLERAARRLIA